VSAELARTQNTGARECGKNGQRTLRVRQFLLPPEARPPAERRPGSRRTHTEQPEWTPERVTLVSLLAVTAAVMAYVVIPNARGLDAGVGLFLILSTTLAAYAFWRRGRRVRGLGRTIGYCFAGGALAGIGNGWLFGCSWALLSGGDVLVYVDAEFCVCLTLLAAAVGVAFGIAYLLPMLTQWSAKSLRPSEGVDRCLLGSGAWGMLVLGSLLSVAFHEDHVVAVMRHGECALAAGLLGVHALMFLAGVTRSLRRSWWLGRVVRGKVPGWLACERLQFAGADLESLEVFCGPWFARTPASGLRVLARRTSSRSDEAYRSSSPVPRFLIG